MMKPGKSSAQKSKPEQTGYLCEAHEKISLVTAILLRDKPRNSVIFCNNRDGMDFVKGHLQKNGFIPSSLRGTIRKVTVTSDEAFRGGKYDCVINFDIPFTPRVYTSRMDAVDKAKPDGRCISLFCDYYSDFAPQIVAKHNLRCGWPPSDLCRDFPPPVEQVRTWLALEPKRDKKVQKARLDSALQDPKPRPRKRSTSRVNYARRKIDEIVEDKPQPKSIWERVLSFLAK